MAIEWFICVYLRTVNFSIIVIVFVFFGGGDGPIGIVVVAAAAGMPEDAVEGVFVGAVGVGEVELQRFLGPMFLARVVNGFQIGVQFIERDDVRCDEVGSEVGLILKAATTSAWPTNPSDSWAEDPK